MNKKLSMLASASLALVFAMSPLASVSAVTPTEGANVTIKRSVTSGGLAVTNDYTYTASFSAGDSDILPGTTPSVPAKATISFAGESNSGKVSKTTTMNFGTVDFKKAGVYVFDIKETGSTDVNNYPLSKTVKKVQVQVLNKNASTPDGKNFTVTVVAKGAGSDGALEFVDGGEGGGSDVTANRTYLTVKNTITGNGADPSTCMPFHLDLSNMPNGVYAAKFSANTCNNKESFEKTGSTHTFDFMLANGETLTFGKGSSNQLLIGKTVTVKQDAVQGYTNSTLTKTVTTNKNHQNKAEYTNTRSLSPQTGVPYSILPYLLVLVAGGLGAGFVAKKRKANE